MINHHRQAAAALNPSDNWLEDAATGLLIRLRRDPRARSLRLTVDARGVRLTLPLQCDVGQGQHFIAENRAWLHRQLDRRDRIAPAQSPLSAVQRLPLRDAFVQIHWRPGRYAKLSSDDQHVAVYLPPRADPRLAQHLLRQFYEAQARKDIAQWLPTYLPSLPRGPSRIKLKQASSLWGSLASDATLALDLALILAPPSIFNYVLVHELCHLIEPNHSHAFWSEVGQRCPNWRQARLWLNRHGHLIKQQLHSWLVAPDLVRLALQHPRLRRSQPVADGSHDSED